MKQLFNLTSQHFSLIRCCFGSDVLIFNREEATMGDFESITRHRISMHYTIGIFNCVTPHVTHGLLLLHCSISICSGVKTFSFAEAPLAAVLLDTIKIKGGDRRVADNGCSCEMHPKPWRVIICSYHMTYCFETKGVTQLTIVGVMTPANWRRKAAICRGWYRLAPLSLSRSLSLTEPNGPCSIFLQHIQKIL